jgi:phosphoribosylformylglycinamidine cyclo-ligase
MVAIVNPVAADLALRSLAARGMKGWVCGKIERRAADTGSALVGNYQER